MIDLLVIGGGHAAMCAAITAAESGLSVTVLESAPQWRRGGNSRHTRNLRVSHSQPTATLVDAYSAQEYWNDIERVTGGATDQTLAQLMIDESLPLLDWLVDHGVHFQPALSGTLSLERTNAFFLGGGKALVDAEYARAARLGVQIRYEHEVVALNLQGHRFVSARVNAGEQVQEFKAHAALVAAGGFQANEGWMREVWGPAADNFLIRGTPHNTGRVLKDLLCQGADPVGEASQCHAVAIDARAPKYDGGIVSRLDCVCFSIVVNQQGERFYDEGEDVWPKRYAIWGRLVAEQPGQIAYAVYDQQVVDLFMPSAFPALQAESIEQLAQSIEVDPAALARTVAAFNAALVDTDLSAYDPKQLDGCATRGLHPAKSNWARPLNKPPYYAYPLRPGITFTYLGLKVDATARVQIGGVPVTNLFAAGEVMAGNILGQGYCAGTGMTIGGVFGRIAGREAVCLRS